MTEVALDPDAGTARVEAGARWWDVTPRASELGDSALHGSSPEINVVGYSVGGGIGWLARKHGLQANRITAVEMVTADGEVRRVDADNDPDLFWAVRGGGGNFGARDRDRVRPRSPLASSMPERSSSRSSARPRCCTLIASWTASASRRSDLDRANGGAPGPRAGPEIVRGIRSRSSRPRFSAARPTAPTCSASCATSARDGHVRNGSAGCAVQLHMDPIDPVPYLSGHAMSASSPNGRSTPSSRPPAPARARRCSRSSCAMAAGRSLARRPEAAPWRHCRVSTWPSRSAR